jgi:hypothetical protein
MRTSSLTISGMVPALEFGSTKRINLVILEFPITLLDSYWNSKFTHYVFMASRLITRFDMVDNLKSSTISPCILNAYRSRSLLLTLNFCYGIFVNCFKAMSFLLLLLLM